MNVARPISDFEGAFSLPAGPASIFTVRTQYDVVEALRVAKEMRGLSNAHLDELANLAAGHTDKVLGPSGAKNLGPISFSAICWALAVKFEMVVDVEQAALMAEYWKDRQREVRNVRVDAQPPSKKIIERAKPHVLRSLCDETARVRSLLDDAIAELSRLHGAVTGTPVPTPAPMPVLANNAAVTTATAAPKSRDKEASKIAVPARPSLSVVGSRKGKGKYR
jgi:hypothetical protein